ncbi:MAG: VOC family protein [Bacteroidales bacterium]|nr:VOC family protein [Bacteroidales bacterium]
MKMQINGIQQLGVGVTNIEEAFAWYRKHFGMDIKMFEEAAMAELMLPHTENEPRSRHAILALNMQGGGGFEIWQHTGRVPHHPEFEIQLGDLGIFIGKLKTSDINKAFTYCHNLGLKLFGEIGKNPYGTDHFFVRDIYNNIWEIIQTGAPVFKTKSITGGVFGVIIGVSDIEKSLVVYRDLLGFDVVEYDVTDSFNDFSALPGGKNKCRRILIKHSRKVNGAFSPVLGPSCIELVQTLDYKGKPIYDGRIWGDPGFIHLCYDINGMDDLREKANQHGFPFTVDSAISMDTFDMGEAAGSFAYIQAPEGTLIEFVETHKIPLIRKIGWYLNFDNRKIKPLPRWVFHLFGLMRVK